MAAKEKEYQRLPGSGPVKRRFSWASRSRARSRLYLGRDHLIRVETGWTENYRRFYYNDILAIVVSNTIAFVAWMIALGLICLIFISFGVVVHDLGARITFAIIAAVFGILLLVHLLLGPTCRATIQTRVGKEELPSLRRLRTARKVIALLKPRIQAAQGDLNVDEVRQGLLPVGHGILSSTQAQEAVSSYRGAIHAWLFAILLVEVLAFAATVLQPGSVPAGVILPVLLAVVVLAVLSLVKQTGSALRPGMRLLAWLSLAHVIMCLAGIYVLMVFTVVSHPKISNNQVEIWKEMFSIQVLPNHALLAVYAFVIVTAFLLAISGLVMWLGSRSAASPETAGPP